MTLTAASRRGQRGVLPASDGRQGGMILGLFTELMAPGGIQRYSRHSAAALVGFARTQARPVRVLSLNDPVGRHRLRVVDEDVPVIGFAGSRIRFALAAAVAAPRTDFTFIGHPNLAPLGIGARLLRPRMRYCVATYGVEIWKRLPLLRRLGLQRAGIVTSISTFSAQRVTAAQWVAEGAVVLIPPALEPTLAPVAAACPSPLRSPGKTLLTVSRLTSADGYKGIDHVIRALPAVRGVDPHVQYVIVGEGDDRDRLERLAAEAGVRDRVHFAGPIPDAHLPACYQACDVFVMPSRDEGFGIVYLEAMAHGKPVVAARSGAAPEIVEDGVTGALVDYGDVRALGERLAGLLSDPASRLRMGDAGRRRVQERYTFEQFRTRLEALLADTMHARAS